MLSIIIFIIILAALIIVHELGHFLVARAVRVRVDEFGLGYPPRATRLFKWKETVFTLNWLPFGGFVKIFGENPDEESISGPESSSSLVHKPKLHQAAVVVAGVVFNVLFAWVLISLGFMIGLPTPISSGIGVHEVKDPKLVITSVLSGSPAFEEGLKAGDVIVSISTVDEAALVKTPSATGGALGTSQETPAALNPEDVSSFISQNGDSVISITYSRGGEIGELKATPREGIIPEKKAIGISMDTIGILELPIHKAFWEGAKTTVLLTKATIVGIATFIYDSVRGHSDLSQVTGPVGIVGLVGDASKLGFIYILSFTAFISINLAVINLIPFPALDGGRLLMIVIESIKKSPINPKIANSVNALGFILLIILMLVVTANDIVRLF